MCHAAKWTSNICPTRCWQAFIQNRGVGMSSGEKRRRNVLAISVVLKGPCVCVCVWGVVVTCGVVVQGLPGHATWSVVTRSHSQ